jgi:hypothetical protein
LAQTLPVSPGVNTVSDSISETDDASMNEPEITTTQTIKPCSPLLPAPTKLVLWPKQIQTALTTFYTTQPRKVVKQKHRAHNPKKRNSKTLTASFTTSPTSTSPKMAPYTPPNKRRNVQTHGLVIQMVIPTDQDFSVMARSSGDISVGQMTLAYNNALQFIGYSLPTTVTPAGSAGSPLVVIDTPVSSPIRSPIRPRPLLEAVQNRETLRPVPPPAPLPPAAHNDEAAFTPGKLRSFTDNFATGKNVWVTEANCHRILNIHYDFRPLQVPLQVEPLVLNTPINTMQRTYGLAAEIAGTLLTEDQLTRVCAQAATNEIDPATRFINANIPTIEAKDAGRYNHNEIPLHDIFFGKHGELYKDSNNQPPRNCVIIMKIKATVPNKRDPIIAHALFLPDVLMLITVNNHVDTKDTHKRVRNAWQIRSEYFHHVSSAHLAKKRDHCNKRLTGKIFGGGDGSTAELLRAAIIYGKPDNRKAC